eukprot:3163119-Pleurochrysis_carterae.AAC.1
MNVYPHFVPRPRIGARGSPFDVGGMRAHSKCNLPALAARAVPSQRAALDRGEDARVSVDAVPHDAPRTRVRHSAPRLEVVQRVCDSKRPHGQAGRLRARVRGAVVAPAERVAAAPLAMRNRHVRARA